MSTRIAQSILNDLIKDLKEKDFKYEPKEEKEIDWAAYNRSKIHEINHFLIFVREAVDNVKLHPKEPRSPGRPELDAYDLAKCIFLKEYFQTGERQAEGLALLFSEKLALKTNPSASSIGRAYSRQDVQEIIGTVFETTSQPIINKETSFSADGTGLPLSIKQNYENDRNEHEKHAGYDKAVVMISNNFHIVTGFVHAHGTAHDSPLFEPVLQQTAEHFPQITDVELDAGFISRNNCDLISNAGATPYIYPKIGINMNQKGSPAWKNMLEKLIENPQKWMNDYHNRSQVECYFSSHKRRFTRPILKRITLRRGVQAFSRITITNVTMLITAYFERRIEVKQFNNAYF